MKKVLIIFLITLLLTGCSSTGKNGHPSYNPKPALVQQQETSGPKPTEQKADDNTTPAHQEPEQQEITFDDQKQVEQLIRSYFSALERKDYSAAWKLTSSRSQESHPESEAVTGHFGMESIKLVSIKAYLPPGVSDTDQAPQDVPTIWFEVELDIKPDQYSACDEGINVRFVMVSKEADGEWRIDGLATSPPILDNRGSGNMD